jgi:hypothetical protein
MPSMKNYRVYSYDKMRHDVAADLIEAATDEAVIAAVETSGFGSKCEIWDGDRLVARLEGERQQA